jgi:hypothetical protein
MIGLVALLARCAPGACSLRRLSSHALAFSLLLGWLGPWAVAGSPAAEMPATSSQASPALIATPLLVADAGNRFRDLPQTSAEYTSRFREPCFDDYVEHSILLPSFANVANLHLEQAELAVPLPPEDFKELDEYLPKLTTSTLDANDQRSVVGGRVLLITPLAEGGKLHTEGRLLWLCEYLQSPGANTTAFFAPGDSAIYATQGLSYGSNWAMLGKRFRWELPSGLSVFAGFDAQINTQQMFHIGSTGLGYSW